jgi:hypothetical protein
MNMSLILDREHLRDLRRSGLHDRTIRLHEIRSLDADDTRALLRFQMPGVRSAMLIPFPNPAGGFMSHVRVKVFPTLTDRRGHLIKYLQPSRSGVRLYFPLLGMDEAIDGEAPLWFVEGEKKTLAVAPTRLTQCRLLRH